MASIPIEEPALEAAIQQANADIFHAQQRNASQEGMGATLVAAVFLPGRVLMASVSDSRMYRLRNGRIEQLTNHTWVHEKLRSRQITPEEATAHPYRSVITRAMGAELNVQPDLREEPSQLGDVYLLCTDGLSNVVTGDDLRQVLASEGPQPAVAGLINLANSRGGPDNITAAVVSYGAAEGVTILAGLTNVPAYGHERSCDCTVVDGGHTAVWIQLPGETKCGSHPVPSDQQVRQLLRP